MVEFGDLTGCKLEILNEVNEDKVADAVVLDHDKAKQQLLVDGRNFPNADALRATVVFQDGPRTIRCQGIVRRQNSDGRREVTLYKAQVIKESRVSTRYDLSSAKTSARVEKVVMEGELRALEQPLEVTVLNISTSGIQLRAPGPELEQGMHFQLVLDIAGQRTIINTEAVRVVSEDAAGRRLGCSFISLEPAED